MYRTNKASKPQAANRLSIPEKNSIGLDGWIEPRISSPNAEMIALQKQVFSMADRLSGGVQGSTLRAGTVELTLTSEGLSGVLLSRDPCKNYLPSDRENLFQPGGYGAHEFLQYVLMTLEQSGELDYIQNTIQDIAASGYRVVASVHYYPERLASMTGFHRDGSGDGHLLFLNLNYNNDTEALGPEYVSEARYSDDYYAYTMDIPETVKKHIQAQAEKIAANPAEKIQCPRIPPHGMFSCCDALVVHSTPLLGSRAIEAVEVTTAIRDHFDALYGKHALQMFMLANQIADNPELLASAGARGNSCLPYANALRLASQKKKIYPDELLGAGLSTTFLDPLFPQGKPMDFGAKFLMKDNLASFMIGASNGLESFDIPSKEGQNRLKRTVSESLDNQMLDNYTDVRPTFMRSWVRLIKASSFD